jgi:ACS family hexuronate transporter-like MFS transporter
LLSRRAAWAVAIVATLTMSVSYIDRTSLAVLGLAVSNALHISNTEFGWLGSAFALAYLFATPLGGWWIDRFGARRGLVLSLLVWTTVAGLHALTPTFGALVALRVALGMAEGPSFPGAAQTVQRVLPPGDRARGFGVLFSGSSIGGMIVPPLASAMFVLAGWRFAFLGTAIAGLAWVPLWIFVTRNAAVRARLDAPPDVVTVERPSFWWLATNRHMWRGWLAVLASAPIMNFGLTWGSKYLGKAFDVTQGEVGHYLWLPPLLFDLGAIAFGDLASRLRRPRALFAVAMVMALALGGVVYAQSPWQAVVLIGVAMAGGGGLYTLLTSELLSRMPANAISFAGGMVAAAQSVVQIVANPLIGHSIDVTDSYSAAIITITAFIVPGCVAWLVLRKD